MFSERDLRYANNLSAMIQAETISEAGQEDKTKFLDFHQLLKDLFPHIFGAAKFENYDGSMVLIWTGSDSTKEPVMFMNHMDVVEAGGQWEHGPFSGDISEGKVWGRGTVDTKGGLWAMLQAADELAAEGFVPGCDIYFVSTCTEETGGEGGDAISAMLQEKGLRFSMVLDEGGMIMYEPIGGAKGKFAMIGVGEKGCADIKFTAKSSGGHASTPGKNTPLVRLGKFMAEAEKSKIFEAQVSPVIREMLTRFAPHMSGAMKFAFKNAGLFSKVLEKAMPAVSPTAGALIKTTIAFTMAKGSEGTNVLPQEAWVIGNMRYSHHQGRDASIKAISDLAAKFHIEVDVIDRGFESGLTDFKGKAFGFVEEAVRAVFPDVEPVPYIMTGASDSRYFSRVSDNCLRFLPFYIDDQQFDSIHGLNENINIDTLAPAVDYYRYIMRRV